LRSEKVGKKQSYRKANYITTTTFRQNI